MVAQIQHPNPPTYLLVGNLAWVAHGVTKWEIRYLKWDGWWAMPTAHSPQVVNTHHSLSNVMVSVVIFFSQQYISTS